MAKPKKPIQKQESKPQLRIVSGYDSKISKLMDKITKIKDYNYEIVIQANKEGLRIKTFDSGKTIYMDINAKAESFSEYECPEPIVVGVDAQKLKNMLKKVSEYNERITLKDNYLIIGKETGEHYILPTIDVREEKADIDVTKLELREPIRISSSELKKAVNNATIVNESVIIQQNSNDTLTIIASGSGVAKYTKTIEGDLNKIKKHEKVTNTFKATYDEKLLKKALTSDSTTEISFGQDKPLLIRDTTGKVETLCLVSPRMNEEYESGYNDYDANEYDDEDY